MLENIVLDPIVASLVALVGVVFGLILGRLVLPGPRKVKKLRAEIEELERKHEAYRGQVGRHFNKTGELIGQMTASYKAVYDHLAEGAHSLARADGALPGSTFSIPRLIVDDAVDVGGPADRGSAGATKSAGPSPAPSNPSPGVQASDAGAKQGEVGASDVPDPRANGPAADEGDEARPPTAADARNEGAAKPDETAAKAPAA